MLSLESTTLLVNDEQKTTSKSREIFNKRRKKNYFGIKSSKTKETLKLTLALYVSYCVLPSPYDGKLKTDKVPLVFAHHTLYRSLMSLCCWFFVLFSL